MTLEEKIQQDAFIRTNTIHLAHAFDLHRAALNPTKDLVILYRNLTATDMTKRQMAKLAQPLFGRRAPIMPVMKRKVMTKFKGKGLEIEEDEDETAGGICLGLWRSIADDSANDAAGPSVTPPIWEVDVIGKQLLGMTWNNEGMFIAFAWLFRRIVVHRLIPGV